MKTPKPPAPLSEVPSLSTPQWFVYLANYETAEVIEFDNYTVALAHARSHDGPDMVSIEVSDCHGRVVWKNDADTYAWELQALLPGAPGFYRWNEALSLMERL